MNSSSPPFPNLYGEGDRWPRAHEDHVIQFYESDDYLCGAVAAFVADGIREREPVVVIATGPHAEQLASRLAMQGLDPERITRTGQLTLQDATRTLSHFMVDGSPDPDLFRKSVGDLIERGSTFAEGLPVRAYGDMVDVLAREGNAAAALRVEELWNELAMTLSFSLLCGYGLTNLHREAHHHQLEKICRAHSRVLPAETYPRNGKEEARYREVTRLQQRALALEHEVAERARLERLLRRELDKRRRTEEALRSARDEAERANRVKSDFLAVMSHELRTPLNAIMGYRELLEQGVGGPVTDQQGMYLHRIRSAADRLTRLIDQVLELSRIEAGRDELSWQAADLCSLARESCAFIEPIVAKKGVRLALQLPDYPVVCETDPGKLGQILLNLLSNAAKFTEEGEITLCLHEDGTSATLDVSDTGIGIEAADLERVFEPFVQVTRSGRRDGSGTGLGLPVSRQLARLLGGDLSVTSTPAEGSSFKLRIPLKPVARPQA